LKALRKTCTDNGVLLILDEIQCGFGRTGTLWGFQQFDIIPDVLLLGKALGGGLPLGAFISSQKIMSTLSDNPVLGHISTFGGHPLSCAAGHAAMNVLLDEHITETVKTKEIFLKKNLTHPKIKSVRSFGLWQAVQFDSFEINKKVIDRCIEKGVLTDWFLFAPDCLRISPPLTISEKELSDAVSIILEVIEEL
jgi:acetylornithine/succinyldiaminopimelate/putrescine aminotransferase